MSDETVNAILDEMRVISREEWFEIARMAGHGGPGFGPMRQLQLKIRHQPLNFGPQLLALIFGKAGEVWEVLMEWPKPKWRVAKEYVPAGFVAKSGLDMHPYETIDPYIDNLERMMDEHGLEDWRTHAASRDLIQLCTITYDYTKEGSRGYIPKHERKKKAKPR